MKISAHALTHPGLKHTDNEDAHLIDGELQLYVICDGVGGHAAGEEASRTSVRVLQQTLRKHRQTVLQFGKEPSPATRAAVIQVVEAGVNDACREIQKLTEADPSKAGMASTLALLMIAGRHALVAHVGDSRVYLLRGGKQFQLTEDHSYVSEKIKKGLMTREQAEASPYRHVITRALGMQENVAADVLTFELMTNDTFIVCSDGLCDYLSSHELLDFSKKAPVETLPTELVHFANSKGGRDNVTVIALKVEAVAQAQADADARARVDAVRGIPLFRQLDYKEILGVMNLATQREHTPGQVVIREGDAGDEFFIIASGSLEVRKGNDRLATLDAGNFFGEMQLIDNQTRSASVVSVTPGHLLVISRNQLYALLRSEPVLAAKVLWEFCRVLNVRLRKVNELFIGEPKQTELEKTLEVEAPFGPQ